MACPYSYQALAAHFLTYPDPPPAEFRCRRVRVRHTQVLPMKIAMLNVNNINKRFGALAAWLKKAAPDVVCLQELKCEQHRFPAAELHGLGYKGGAEWSETHECCSIRRPHSLHTNQ